MYRTTGPSSLRKDRVEKNEGTETSVFVLNRPDTRTTAQNAPEGSIAVMSNMGKSMAGSPHEEKQNAAVAVYIETAWER